MFQVIQTKKTKGNVRVWKKETYKQYWEEALQCLNEETKSGFYKNALVTARVLMQDRKELTDSVPLFYKRLMGTYKTKDIAEIVKQKIDYLQPTMEHTIVEQ